MVMAPSGLTGARDRVHMVRQMFEKAKARKEQYHKRWDHWYKILWEARSPGLRGSSTPNRLGRPQSNEIMPIITALVGWLGDARPNFSMAPANYNPESPGYDLATQLALDMEHVFAWVQTQNNFDLENEKTFFDALTYGTGIYAGGWEPDFHGPNVGEASIRWTDAWDFFPDPIATSERNWRFCCERVRMSRDEAISRYGEIARDVNSDIFSGMKRPTQLTKSEYARAPMAIAGPILGQATVYGSVTAAEPVMGPYEYEEVVLLKCWWIDPDDDRWKLSIVGGGEELAHFDVAGELFEFGQPPYSRLVVHDIGEFWGPSLVSFLVSGQEALNDLLFHAHNNIRLAGDPMWLEAVQAGTARTRLINRPGQRIPVSAPGMVDWMRPPDMPMQVIQMLEFWVQSMERTSGLAGVTRGASPMRRESADAFGAMAEGSATRVRNVLRNLEATHRRVGEMTASIVAEHYTSERVIALAGPEGAPTAVALRPKHFWLAPDGRGEAQPLQFSLWVEAGSSNPASRTAQIAEAQTMVGMGIIDREAYLKFRRWPGWKAIVDRIAQKEAAGAFNPPAGRKRQR